MTRTLLIVVALIAAFGLLTPHLTASGNQGKSKQSKQGAANQQKNKGHEKNKPQYKDHDQGWERRDQFEYRVYSDRTSRPPGWSRGKKTGWDNCGVPPGQAKKGECRTYFHQGFRYYYFRDGTGRIVVRRQTQ